MKKFYVVQSSWHADRLFAGERKNLKAAVAEMLGEKRGPVLVALWETPLAHGRTMRRYEVFFFENGRNTQGLPELPDDSVTTFETFDKAAHEAMP